MSPDAEEALAFARDRVGRWADVWDVTVPPLEEVRGNGIGELPDETPLCSTDFRIWAANEGAARAIDGATGRPPDDIDEFDYIERNAREQVLALPIDGLDCGPLP
jgi:hypothetical protein